MFDFDAYEAVDELIDEINAGYYSESYSDDEYMTGEEVYESIHAVLTEQVEAGEITLEFANEVNDMAYEKYVTEAVNKKNAIAGAAAGLLSVVGLSIPIVNHFKTKKGYANVPELATIRDDIVGFKSDITKTKNEVDATWSQLIAKSKEYNEIASKFDAPTIQLSNSDTSAKTVNEEIGSKTSEADHIVRNKQSSNTKSSSKEIRNDIYDPEKAMELRNKAAALKQLGNKYQSLWGELVSEVSRLNTLRRKLNKIARKKSHSPEDVAFISKTLKNINDNYSDILKKVQKLK